MKLKISTKFNLLRLDWISVVDLNEREQVQMCAFVFAQTLAMLQKHRNLGDEKIVQNKLYRWISKTNAKFNCVSQWSKWRERRNFWWQKKNWININVMIHMSRERKNSSAQICNNVYVYESFAYTNWTFNYIEN